MTQDTVSKGESGEIFVRQPCAKPKARTGHNESRGKRESADYHRGKDLE
jgi:hypothetical protein